MIDTIGSRQKEPATTGGGEEPSQQQPLPERFENENGSISRRGELSRTSTSSSPQRPGRQARAATAGSDGPDEASSQNSVDNLLRRIARDAGARQARADKSEGARRRVREEEERRYHEPGSSRSSLDHTTRHGRQPERQPEKRRPPSQGSTRRSRWGKSEDYGTSAQLTGGGGGGGGGDKDRTSPARAGAARDTAASVAEANPFTESMWEDTSCRQVLQAMFFAPDSAVPAGSTEEYKELEGVHTYGVCCLLFRRG